MHALLVKWDKYQLTILQIMNKENNIVDNETRKWLPTANLNYLSWLQIPFQNIYSNITTGGWLKASLDSSACMSSLSIGPYFSLLFTCVALAKAGLEVVHSVRPSIRPFVCPQHFWGA